MWIHVIPIKTRCEVLFGYMLIIKIFDYVLIDYSVFAFEWALRASANRAFIVWRAGLHALGGAAAPMTAMHFCWQGGRHEEIPENTAIAGGS
ncbi:hypothetical protein [Pseudomonas tolaasii]|uniref:hypothetical protein n=1 Tax=Pseudomonas tolaasii TaxID=29442 RepID=UPI0012FD5AA8|nr:hypothetical protein [Pseudomonas tolaasii]